MKAELGEFLESVWIGRERFLYVAAGRERYGRPAPWPVGMLSGRILWDEPSSETLRTWSAWLREPKTLGRGRPGLYTLYYGVRMDVWLNKKLSPRWMEWLEALSKKQIPSGPLAESFPRRVGSWIARYGATLTSAFALLTMEHALFLR